MMRITLSADYHLRHTMPTPPKFTQARKERILQVLRAGGSRREAARAAGIHPVTLGRWLAAGRTSKAPDGRWAVFCKQVREAEGSKPELQLLRDRFEYAMASSESAWRFLDRLEQEEQEPALSEPVTIELTFASFKPPTPEGDPA